MNKYVSKLFWQLLRQSIDKIKIITIILCVLIPFLLVWGIESRSAPFCGINADSWRAVAGSIFAASLFLTIQSFIFYLKDTKESLYKKQYDKIIEENGIKSIYTQRGGNDVIGIYENLIKNSERRIWAIGMTNNHFCKQHFDKILDKMDTNKSSGKTIDVVISFWNPNISFYDDDKKERLHKIIDVQHIIEGNNGKQHDIKDKIYKLIEKVEKRKLKGTFKIVYTSLPSNFTCFIIDDDVFFFPFLSGPDSTNDPTIHCDASKGIGKSITAHIEKIIEPTYSDFTSIVYQKNKIPNAKYNKKDR
jgi:hypothetical protein